MSSLRLGRFRVARLVAVTLTVFAAACGVPDYAINSTPTDAGSTSTGGASGNTFAGAGGQNGGSSGSSGAATGGQSAPGCSSNSDCSTLAATKVCDNSISPGRCVECLPGVTDCGSGLFCDTDKQCHVGCSSNTDCEPTSCDASACATLTCDANTHLCTGCAQDSDCSAGTKCNTKTGTCSPSCSNSNTCPTGWVCCAGTCANLKTDATNCASCGTTCAQPNANVQCFNGTCRIESCVEGYADCNGKYTDGCETDLLSDASNCKACNAACSTALVCRDGTCSTASCSDGYANCDNNPSNSCRTNTLRDVQNCGSCGNSCSTTNGQPSCVGGVCSMSCNSGWGDCNSSANDGCETDLTSTSDHCGTCQVACTNGHGSTSCVASKCSPKCGSGFGDCNGDPIDGCETTLTTDSNNCGSCNNICALDHASSTCNSGKCAISTCTANYGDCNGVASDGCEEPLLTSVADCGKCGNACSSTNGKNGCIDGQCTIACNANFGNCDNDVSNGCETDLTKSVKNCGTCGNTCADTTVGSKGAAGLRALVAGGRCAPATLPARSLIRASRLTDRQGGEGAMRSRPANNTVVARAVLLLRPR